MYISVLEVVLLSFVVFIIAPILFVSETRPQSNHNYLMFRLTVVLEHCPHMCWTAPTTNELYDQARDWQTAKISR